MISLGVNTRDQNNIVTIIHGDLLFWKYVGLLTVTTYPLTQRFHQENYQKVQINEYAMSVI